jgi:hypothetical protein
MMSSRLVNISLAVLGGTLAACASRPHTEVAAVPASHPSFYADSVNLISCAQRVAAPYGFDRGLRHGTLVRRVDGQMETIFVWPYVKGDTLRPGAFFANSPGSTAMLVAQQINTNCLVARE